MFIGQITECISTVSYSLIINRGLTKQFQGKRGISQWDPMFPYLFVLAMEYLQREMDVLKGNPQFHFHPKCKKFGVAPICFAYNLLISCKADLESIRSLQEAFHRLSVVSGLQANAEKSSIFLSGVKSESKVTLLTRLGYIEGEIPFKYLEDLFQETYYT